MLSSRGVRKASPAFGEFILRIGFISRAQRGNHDQLRVRLPTTPCSFCHFNTGHTSVWKHWMTCNFGIEEDYERLPCSFSYSLNIFQNKTSTKKQTSKPNMVVHTFNLSTSEAERQVKFKTSLVHREFQESQELHRETMSQSGGKKSSLSLPIKQVHS